LLGRPSLKVTAATNLIPVLPGCFRADVKEDSVFAA
jgi:hypothetical protein